MRPWIFIGIIFLLAGKCHRRNANNPYLQPPSFRISMDMNLPAYSSLQYPGNSVYIDQGGILGVIVYNNGSQYLAFEAADPNHYAADCRAMQADGARAQCPCDHNTYTLLDGHLTAGSGDYPMIPYHTSVSGNILYIYN